nr:exodeoxyribonuclease VII small subunit [uncultured Porphyromonas sp.]
MKETLSYKEAAARLEQIVRYIEQDSPDVDELTKLVEEAVQLSKYCRRKLTEADKQLTSLMAQLSEDNEEAHG